jgi:hypothetical protein
MFNLSGFFKVIGISFLTTIIISFIIGFINLQYMVLALSLIFFASYIVTGIFAPVFSPKTPYFTSFLASVTMTLFNFLCSMFIMNVLVFADPVGVNRSLVISSTASLVTTFIALQIMKRRQGVTV